MDHKYTQHIRPPRKPVADIHHTFGMYASERGGGYRMSSVFCPPCSHISHRYLMTVKDVTHWCRDARVLGENLNMQNIGAAFNQIQPNTRTLTSVEVDRLVTQLTPHYRSDNRKRSARSGTLAHDLCIINQRCKELTCDLKKRYLQRAKEELMTKLTDEMPSTTTHESLCTSPFIPQAPDPSTRYHLEHRGMEKKENGSNTYETELFRFDP